MSDDQRPPDDARSEATVDDPPAAATAQAESGPGPDPGEQADAGPEAGPKAGAKKAARGQRKHRSFWRELPVLIIVALVIALVVKTFVVQAFFIPSSSMENTLEINDKVLVSKLTYHFRSIQPGDIVVFDGAGSWDPAARQPASSDPVVRLYDATLRPLLHAIAGLFGTAPGQTDYIKRVIGVPGDHVACCNARGDVTVNGVALHESSYLYPGERPSEQPFSITVPPGRLWVMGDHRLVSDDSRGHMGDPGRGTIPENMVIGRAFMIVWPPSRWRILPIPSTFSQPGIQPAAAARARAGTAGGGAAGRTTERNAAAAALLRGVAVRPSPPYLPLTAGFAAALPLTWLQRRARISWSGRRRGRR